VDGLYPFSNWVGAVCVSSVTVWKIPCPSGKITMHDSNFKLPHYALLHNRPLNNKDDNKYDDNDDPKKTQIE
jgi:hypothetical protein